MRGGSIVDPVTWLSLGVHTPCVVVALWTLLPGYL